MILKLKEKFVILISDAAKYMMKSGQNLNNFCEIIVHVICFAHLIYNCCLIIKSYYKNVDDLISSIKNLIVKNKRNQKLFEEIKIVPDVVITRWSRCLKADLFMQKNFIQLKILKMKE